MLLEFALQSNEEVLEHAPAVNKIFQCVPHLIASACSFGTDPNLEDLLDDEVYAELIV